MSKMKISNYCLTEDNRGEIQNIFNFERNDGNFLNLQILILLNIYNKQHPLQIEEKDPSKTIIADDMERKIIDLTESDIGFDGKTFYCEAEKAKNEFQNTGDEDSKILEDFMFEFMAELFEMDIDVLKKGWEG